MTAKKEVEKEVKPAPADAEQMQSAAGPVESGPVGGVEPQPLQEPGKEDVLILPQGDKPPQEQPKAEDALNPDEIVLWRNDTDTPVLLGETYLFPANSRKARRGDGAGKGLTEL